MKLARCQCLDAVAHGGNPQDRAASLPRKMPIPRQDAYSTGATQGREQSLAALEART
ncbi:MAG: hypothetical protein F6J98_14365 [Moorea sp. SIO4G2]|uniref:hypothetical protein n=1 Tax=unclassified Moorena TaxID=2683338 RepID=UPI0013F9A552|nr:MULTISPECIES: hypothetical protein [unclassified Moorena]NEO12561.1 hypothetical protein [Moorena sp. SIO3E8]NEO61548.1 hypothetical protein [Moorena sp. SIO4G2]NEP97809.1 hypothetical protein [Moorena sp. SIO3F7]